MNIFTQPVIKGISVTIPKNKIVLNKLQFGEDVVNRISKLTGIYEVCVADKDRTVADFCIDAAERLFNDLGYDRNKIDGIILVTPGPDYILPGTSGVIQSRLGLPHKCVAMDINHGCSGFIYSLFQGFLLVESGYCHEVLVCCGDTPSKYINEQDKALKLLMGDGGAAAIITRGDNASNTSFSFYNDGDGIKHLYIPAGSNRMPKQYGVTDQEIEDDEGNIRTLENLYMNGLEVMRFAMNEVKNVVFDVLRRQKWNKDDVDIYAFHQANEFILKSLAKQMKLINSKVLINVAKTGNIGPASIPLTICKEVLQRADMQMDKSVLCGFGSGFSCAAMAVNLSDTYFSNINEI